MARLRSTASVWQHGHGCGCTPRALWYIAPPTRPRARKRSTAPRLLASRHHRRRRALQRQSQRRAARPVLLHQLRHARHPRLSSGTKLVRRRGRRAPRRATSRRFVSGWKTTGCQQCLNLLLSATSACSRSRLLLALPPRPHGAHVVPAHRGSRSSHTPGVTVSSTPSSIIQISGISRKGQFNF